MAAIPDATLKLTVDTSEVVALASHLQCVIVGCSESGTERVQAKLDIFGSPDVQVYFCERHHSFFFADAARETPDIVVEEQTRG